MDADRGSTLRAAGHVATKDHLGDMRRGMATKDQIVALHGQINSIEQQLRETKIEVSLGELEDKVFGASPLIPTNTPHAAAGATSSFRR